MKKQILTALLFAAFGQAVIKPAASGAQLEDDDFERNIERFLGPRDHNGVGAGGSRKVLEFAQLYNRGVSKNACPFCPIEIIYSALRPHVDRAHTGWVYKASSSYIKDNGERSIIDKGPSKPLILAKKALIEGCSLIEERPKDVSDMLSFEITWKIPSYEAQECCAQIEYTFKKNVQEDAVKARQAMVDKKNEQSMNEYRRHLLHSYLKVVDNGTAQDWVKKTKPGNDLKLKRDNSESLIAEVTENPKVFIDYEASKYSVHGTLEQVIDKLKCIKRLAQQELDKRDISDHTLRHHRKFLHKIVVLDPNGALFEARAKDNRSVTPYVELLEMVLTRLETEPEAFNVQGGNCYYVDTPLDEIKQIIEHHKQKAGDLYKKFSEEMAYRAKYHNRQGQRQRLVETDDSDDDSNDDSEEQDSSDDEDRIYQGFLQGLQEEQGMSDDNHPAGIQVDQADARAILIEEINRKRKKEMPDRVMRAKQMSEHKEKARQGCLERIRKKTAERKRKSEGDHA